MTALQAAYAELRADGRGHYSALVALEERYGIDRQTIARAITSADLAAARGKAA